MKEYLDKKISDIQETIGDGVPHDEYLKSVGKISALKDISRDFKRMIDVKNELIKKYENG